MKKNLTLFLFGLALPALAFAHGEDKFGPHGGYIQMPSNYHTEVVPEGSDKIKIYLLDIKWKNPVLRNSSVNVALVQNGSTSPLKCEVRTDFFLCELPKGKNLKSGTLEIDSMREKQKGALAKYELPLTLMKPKTDHSGHH